MIRGVIIQPPNNGGGGGGGGGFGIKKRSWFGGGRSRVRPAFMEPLLEGRNIMDRGRASVDIDRKFTADYYAHDWRKDAMSGGGGLRMRRSSSSSSPPSALLKDDAGYIGYITDDESGSGHEEEGHVMNIVRRRRSELLRTDADISFSGCLFMMITAVVLLFLFLFAVSPWGVPPPRRL
jgi:hypothetical protein